MAPSAAADPVRRRHLFCLIWQSLASLLLLPFLLHGGAGAAILSFIAVNLSLLLLSFTLRLLLSPRPRPLASPLSLALTLFKLTVKVVVGGFEAGMTAHEREKARVSLAVVLFVTILPLAGGIGAVGVCRGEMAVAVGGMVFGAVYGVVYVWRRRWVLRFPVVQRPLFYSFKMGIFPCLKLAVKLSTLSFVCSTVLVAVLTDQLKRNTVAKIIMQQIKFYVGLSVVSFSWELSQHLLQVVHTRRYVFAPPQGSAAAEANPSEALLDAIEQSSPRSLIQYLAYLDMCMVTESNADPWRRAIFFEETGEAYRRVMTVCLRPLEQFTSSLAEALEGLPVDKSDVFAQQLNSPTDANVELRLQDAFNDFQLCTWCARTVSALTARSHREDVYGVAQLNGCNTAVVSTLLSCLLAVEACLGKKTYSQPAQLVGPASIKWATSSTTRDIPTAPKIRRRGALQGIAYAMADVLRTSTYHIVSAFEADMQASAKAAALEKTWIADGKPLYGTNEVLAQKLALFLEYRAT